jgi:hypothetical protein
MTSTGILLGGLAVVAIAASVGVGWYAARRQVGRVLVLHWAVVAIQSGAVVVMSVTVGKVAAPIVLIEVGVLLVALAVAVLVAVVTGGSSSSPLRAGIRDPYAHTLAQAWRDRMEQEGRR